MGLFDFLFKRRAPEGAGGTPESAIVVESVPAEYEWVEQNCPGYRPISQSLADGGGKMFDVLVLQNRRGEERTVYFDITGFFGKE